MSCESTLCVTLALSSFVILACVPLLVRWRWGLGAALLSAIATVALLFAASHYAIDKWIAPPLPEPSPCGDEGRRFGAALLLFFLPGAATLAGAGLALLRSTFAVCWRLRRRQEKP